jgi:UDP-N-acetylglucosamine acyltransferase
MAIHPTAIVDPKAHIADTAVIGPYCVVGPDVEIAAGTRLMAHVYVDGPTWIGGDNIFYPYSTVGVTPQDLKYKGERSETRIGNRNRIREFVTIHRGTEGGGMVTCIGDDNLLMAYVHVAHDAQVANHVVLANAVTLGGHVLVGDWAVVGASTGVHQFCRVGRHAIVGGYSVITQDVLPFSTTVSERGNRVFGANATGLERRGFASERIEDLQKALRLLTRAGLNTSQAIERIRAEIPSSAELEELLAFIAASERGFVK